MTPDDIERSPDARLGDRSLFPDLRPRAYLNHAAVSPPSLPVRRAARRVMDDYAHSGAAAFGGWVAQRERLRGKLAAFVGARSEDIGLVPNTTQGVIDIALCFPWRRGDRVVTFHGEFPANVTPWHRAAELFDLDVERLPLQPFARSHAVGLERLEEVLRRGAVRMVAVSFVQFQTGLRMPLKQMAELCHRYDAQLFVDAIQGCGVLPLDVSRCGIDYASCGGHKWMMGLEGAGFLYVHPQRVRSLQPRVAGWLGHEDPLTFLFDGPGRLRYDRPMRPRADFVEPGAYNAVGYAALEAAVDLIAGLGVSAIEAHVGAYLDALETGLAQRGLQSLRSGEAQGRSGILGVLPPEGVDVVRLRDALVGQGVACTIPDGVLRFAPHWPNDPDEVPFVLEAVDRALRGLQ